LAVVMQKGIVLPPESDVMKSKKQRRSACISLGRKLYRWASETRRGTKTLYVVGKTKRMGNELHRIDKAIVLPVLGCW